MICLLFLMHHLYLNFCVIKNGLTIFLLKKVFLIVIKFPSLPKFRRKLFKYCLKVLLVILFIVNFCTETETLRRMVYNAKNNILAFFTLIIFSLI